MASQVVESMTDDFNPDRYHDDYQEQLQELIQAKLEGGEAFTTEEQPQELDETEDVSDLLAKLEASVKARTAARAGGGFGRQTGPPRRHRRRRPRPRRLPPRKRRRRLLRRRPRPRRAESAPLVNHTASPRSCLTACRRPVAKGFCGHPAARIQRPKGPLRVHPCALHNVPKVRLHSNQQFRCCSEAQMPSPHRWVAANREDKSFAMTPVVHQEKQCVASLSLWQSSHSRPAESL